MDHSETVAAHLPSPFHRGEKRLQQQLGVRDRMELFGKKVIRDYLPEQHRDFYQQLTYLFIGHVDHEGWPWASILVGEPGFIETPHNRQLTIDAQPITGDPLKESLTENSKVGLLGIELNTRRRNRVAAHIKKVNKSNFELNVDQAFGNCPKYIQDRTPTADPGSNSLTVEYQQLNALDSSALELIGKADTFFVSSFITSKNNETSEGVDISHRGGLPGFIAIDKQSTLTIPDYSGNMHFNTLGNFIENPKAGLLFIDFEKGHLLMLTGKVSVIFDSPAITSFDGAERIWTFEFEKGLWLKNALQVKWQFQSYSPFLAPREKAHK